MINDQTITDIFIQDFILEVCGVIVIVVGQISQNEQKFIESILFKYKAKKKIIIVHNFANLNNCDEIEKKIEKDIVKGFDTVEKNIPKSDLCEFIEKNTENIRHFVIGAENKDSGFRYNKRTFQYLKDIFLNTNFGKKPFDFYAELKRFIEKNYRVYLQFKKTPISYAFKGEIAFTHRK